MITVRTAYTDTMPKEINKPLRFEMRLSPEDDAYLTAVAAKLGVTRAAAFMAGLRLLASRSRLKVEVRDALAAQASQAEEEGR